MDNILVVDRIVSDFAVCEQSGGGFVDIPLADLPKGVAEGDCLRLEGKSYVIDKAQAARNRAINKALFDKLRRKSN